MPHSILIVEDDLTFATMLKTWLGKKGFSVDTASSNARARKQLTHNHTILSCLICACPIKMVSSCFHG